MHQLFSCFDPTPAPLSPYTSCFFCSVRSSSPPLPFAFWHAYPLLLFFPVSAPTFHCFGILSPNHDSHIVVPLPRSAFFLSSSEEGFFFAHPPVTPATAVYEGHPVPLPHLPLLLLACYHTPITGPSQLRGMLLRTFPPEEAPLTLLHGIRNRSLSCTLFRIPP